MIDFDFSVNSPQNTPLDIFCGTPSYMAPEIIKKNLYDSKNTDIWALGILIIKMLTGIFPFRGSSENKLYRKIKTGNFKLPNYITKELNDLLERIFLVNSVDRISADQILKHKWFSFGFSKAC